jgi:hypothetical protein
MISPSKGRYLHTGQHNTHTHTHTQKNTRTVSMPLSGIQTHDPSFRSSEDCSCLRPCSHCDRHILVYFIFAYFSEARDILKEFVLLDIMQCSPLKSNRCFGGICCLHLYGGSIRQAGNKHGASSKQSLVSKVMIFFCNSE